MSNSNKNNIKEKTLFENITNFDDFRNQFQRAIDFVVRNRSVDIDVSNFLTTSGSTFENNGWQFKISNVESAQSNTNTNSAPNLSSEKKEEIKDAVNQNILNEITAGLDNQTQNSQACTKQFFDNLEAFELKVDSAEILWLLERLKPEENQNIGGDQNNLSEIFGRYIKKLIHRSEILQLEGPEQKLFIYSLQALSSCAAKIIFKRNELGLRMITTQEFSEGFKTNFQQLETITKRAFSVNSLNVQKEADKAKSKIVNNVFVVVINGIILLNSDSNGQFMSSRGGFFYSLMSDVRIISKDLSPDDKLEIIKFLSRENSNSDSRKKFDYLDYNDWAWKTATDLDSVFKLTIDKFDYSNLDLFADSDGGFKGWDSENGVFTNPINYYNNFMHYVKRGANGSTSNCIKKELFKLVAKLSLPDAINVIRSCHSSLLPLLFYHYCQEDLNKLLKDNTKNVLICLLTQYKSKSKINPVIADIWESNFKAQINELSKIYDFDRMESGILESLEKIAEDIEELFAKVENVFSSEVSPETVFDVLKIFYRGKNDNKLKKLIADNNIFNLFIEQVEQNVRKLITEANENTDFAQFKSLIKNIKNNSVKLSIDDKSKIVGFLLSEDFDYENNLSKATNKLENLVKVIDSNQNNDGNNKSQEKNGEGFSLNKIETKIPVSQSITQQSQEFKLELTLSNNKVIALSSSSCQTAIGELRQFSDFCYQICSIKEAIKQKKCPEASDCWSQLCKQFTWWESIKVTLYSLFMFGIAKWWHGNINIEIKSSMPTRQNASFLKDNQDNKKVPDSKDKGKTFNNIDQPIKQNKRSINKKTAY